jgi:hypothetical protein
MAFENKFSTSEKLFKACSSLSRDRRGWVCMLVSVVKGRSRLTALGLSFSITAYQARASVISVLSILHPNKWSRACVSLWSGISTDQYVFYRNSLARQPMAASLLFTTLGDCSVIPAGNSLNGRFGSWLKGCSLVLLVDGNSVLTSSVLMGCCWNLGSELAGITGLTSSADAATDDSRG